jgi:internalin A
MLEPDRWALQSEAHLPEVYYRFMNTNADLAAARIQAALREGATTSISLRGLRLTDHELPDALADLTNLSDLDLSENHLSGVPEVVLRLTNLRSLTLTFNQITALPNGISELSALHTLDLRGNRLTQFPGAFRRLQSLRRLTIGPFKSLPEELADLQLEELFLFYMNVEERSFQFPALPRLKSLGLHECRGRCLTATISNLSTLTKICLSDTEIEELPDNLNTLVSLETLDLAANKLKTLPRTIAALHHLKELDLSDNLLIELPSELADLNQLRALKLNGNLWAEPLPEFIKRGTQAVLGYLRSLADGVPQYEAKLIFIGEGGVGKSTLLAALQDKPFLKDRPTTHGIDIARLTIPHPTLDNVALSLNCWDFGGQDVYRITHQFFFSNRSLYLLVWKPREGQEANGIDGWLRRIRLRIKDARVLIIASHCLERRPELDYPAIKVQFGEMIVGCLEVDSSTGKGIRELLALISVQASRLPQMGERLSASWIRTRDDVLATRLPQLSRATVDELGAARHLTITDTETLLNFLHDLGRVIYYSDDEGLRDFVVVEPEWLTKAIGYVLEDRLTVVDKGLLDHRRLKGIWLDQVDKSRIQYPLALHPYFLRLMEKFDISYRIESDLYSLVAQLVPYLRPAVPWELSTAVSTDQRELRLLCRMDDEPPGLIAWLTVRNHRFSTGAHWRKGVFLSHQHHQALIELRSPQELSVSVRGRSPDHFFHILKDGIEYLIRQRWPGLSYEFWIPCSRPVGENEGCQGLFEYSDLVRAREVTKRTLECRKCFQDIDVSQLLTGFEAPQAPIEQQLVEVQRLLSNGVALQSETSEVVRRLLRAVAAETPECPRLFSIEPMQSKWSDIGMLRMKLRLWCEHPGCEHSVGQPMEFKKSKDWFRKVAPYLDVVARTLRLVVPLAGPAVEIALSDSDAKLVAPELKEMEKVCAYFLAGQLDAGFDGSKTHEGFTRAQGSALREFQVLLLEVDKSKTWGGLRRVQASTGDYLWVCPEHYAQYDPGLPRLPYLVRSGL